MITIWQTAQSEKLGRAVYIYIATVHSGNSRALIHLFCCGGGGGGGETLFGYNIMFVNGIASINLLPTEPQQSHLISISLIKLNDQFRRGRWWMIIRVFGQPGGDFNNRLKA